MNRPSRSAYRGPTPGNVERGYVKTYRSMFDGDDPFWNEGRPRTEWEARLDLLRMAHYRDEPSEVLVHGCLLRVGYGEVLSSQRALAKRWGWGRQRVRGFFGRLKTLGTVEDVPLVEALVGQCPESNPPCNPPCMHIRFRNFAAYNANACESNPPRDPAPAQHQPHPRTEEPKKEDEEGPRGDADEPPSSPAFNFASDLLKSNRNGPWHVEPALHDRLAAAYPAVDPGTEYRKAAAWLAGNPARRKTRRGMPKFLHNWMRTAQTGIDREEASRPRTEAVGRLINA